MRRLAAVVAITALAFSALVFVGGSSPRSARTTSGPALAKAGARSQPTLRSAERPVVAAALAELYRSTGVTAEPLSQLTHSPGMPTCTPPPIPAATYPPGHGYGVPFLAAVTGGQVLAGYDEWEADNNAYKTDSKTYHLYPWANKISDITGWVTGLLQLPSLSAQIPPQDVVLCDQGGKSCVANSPPPVGECIHVFTQYGPSPASHTPPPPVTNYPLHAGANCFHSSGCLAIVPTLTPTGDTTLTATGVEPDGALDLQVTTAAVTTLTDYSAPPSTASLTCSNGPGPTVITLSTKSAITLPPSAPPAPTPPNRDYRRLQTTPQALSGPLASASSTGVSNDFQIPAFIPSTGSSGLCSNAGFLPDIFNTYVGGFGPTFADQGEGLYYLKGGHNPIVASPGWAQFSATTTVVKLGLPVGPPAGFHFGTPAASTGRR